MWAKLTSTEGRRGLLMVAPPFIYVLIMLAFPIGAIVLFSFWTQDFMTLDTTFTLANYREIWEKPIFGALLKRSLFVSGCVTIVTVILAFPVAYFVSFHVAPARKSLWLFLITIPFWTSYLIRVFLWKVILGYNGVVNSGLMSVGIIDEPLTFILYNVNAVIITLAHAFAPFAILPIFVALEKDRPFAFGSVPRFGRNKNHHVFPRHAAFGDAGCRGRSLDRVHPHNRGLRDP